MSDPWYKRNARDFYEGTRRLTLEQRGAYTDLIDLIYIHDGDVPDDDDWIAHALHISRRKWRVIRAALMAAGKIASVDGQITNSRAVIELEERRRRREINRENALGQRRFETGSRVVRSGTSNEPTPNSSKKINKNNETEKQIASPYKKLEEERQCIAGLEGSGDETARAPETGPPLPDDLPDRVCRLVGPFADRWLVADRLKTLAASFGLPRLMAGIDDLEAKRTAGTLRSEPLRALHGFVANAKPRGDMAPNVVPLTPERAAEIQAKARAKRAAERGVIAHAG